MCGVALSFSFFMSFFWLALPRESALVILLFFSWTIDFLVVEAGLARGVIGGAF